ncbi:MAG: DUF1848 domain-containing protein [Candidatus Izemoplasma sp.]|nr:DUF1848 domain-containing protein [Candidatus Izemoplasma sp.]
MIITASRRTDIPAFYAQWFINRIREGYVLTANPYNPNQIKHISLTPKSIDVIVFWTKNAASMLPMLNKLNGFNYYFQYTVTPYQKDIEEQLPKIDIRVKTFKVLADKIGLEKVIWRYDPILLTDKYTIDFHIRAFTYLCEKLKDSTHKVIISFLDEYAKIRKTLKTEKIYPLSNKEIDIIAYKFSEIANKHDLSIETCGEAMDLSMYGISHAKCIDSEYINHVFDKKLIYEKDPYQRETCLCMDSIDIGAYNSCKHFCKYCYANYHNTSVINNTQKHDPNSPLLIGHLTGEETITKVKKVPNLFSQ